MRCIILCSHARHQVLANDEDSLSFAAGAFSNMPGAKMSDLLVQAFDTGIGVSYNDWSQLNGAASCHQTKRMLVSKVVYHRMRFYCIA